MEFYTDLRDRKFIQTDFETKIIKFLMKAVHFWGGQTMYSGGLR